MASSKLLLPIAAVFAILAASSRKKTSSGSSGTGTIPDGTGGGSGSDVEEEDMKEKDDPKPDNNPPPPPKEEAPPSYALLTETRKAIADAAIKNMKLVQPGPKIWHDYSVWATSQTSPNYINFLTNQIYWAIAQVEKKSEWQWADNITKTPLPFLLRCGEVVNPAEWAKGFAGAVEFSETQAACNARLKAGKALWAEIQKYVKNNIKGCPMGATC